MRLTKTVTIRSDACCLLDASNQCLLCWHMHMPSHASNGEDSKSITYILVDLEKAFDQVLSGG